MAQKGFGVKELNIAAAASGNPAIEAVTDELDLKAAKIGISTDIQVGRNVNAVGILTASSVNDVAGNVRQIVSNSKSTTYQIVKSDVGELINTTAGVTVPANLSPALVAGDAITIYNNLSLIHISEPTRPY